MSDVYIGLDPSLTGFGVAAVGPGLDSTWLLSPKKRGVDRLLEISYSLSDLFADIQRGEARIADVAIEDTVRASYSASALGELAGTVKITCHTVLEGQARYPLKVPPATLKKFATGRGNAKKVEVMLSAYKKWDKEFTDDNEADAYVLARIASGYATTLYEKEIQKNLADLKFRDAHV